MNRVRLLPSQLFWNSPVYLKLTNPAWTNYPVINLYINERREGDVTVLDLKGRVRVGGTSLALHRSIHTLIQEEKVLILLNLYGVTHIDSCGIGELVASHISVQNKGGQLRLLKLTESLREVLAITKVLDVFDVYESEADALLSFSQPVAPIRKPQPFFV